MVKPFGLKNAGATYQRFMDRILEGMLGRNVDDMVVKSTEASNHVQDLKELFQALDKYKLKLNPEKCVFGVKTGKFLGFMLTQRGIEMNPEKCDVILNMQSPTSVKEVQQLAGRMTSLSRFIPKAGERSVSFFKCLQDNSRFAWTKECEEAFQKLKQLLASPLILIKPMVGIPTHLYLCVTERAVSTVLTQEKEKEQRPIYFVSRILQGVEMRYQKIEKAALAVVITTRRLRYYFQNFQVIVKKTYQSGRSCRRWIWQGGC